ncbi:PREDICTED: protein YLS3-like isoform X2 [Tarenaya hassleriana]|uniref:protein YLS3-like isoform X2 n=1 Tax=Tarenaya hassleriana TaxID=28532 RepID=UPI00053CA447|nr:PREDICTED: protein YLS3-like isoform X2 [Tarenaya hassleriana]
MERSRRSWEMWIMAAFLLLGSGNSDLAQDRAECSEQLVGLATCLPYVGGEAKAPTRDCCAGFKDVVDKSRKCICILIKDRNDPQLGLKINATLAVLLPTLCHQSSPNISACTSLLHLPPNSPEAKEFESLGKIEGNANSTSSSPKPKGAREAQGAEAASEKSNGDKRESWLAVFTLIHALFLSHRFTTLFY